MNSSISRSMLSLLRIELLFFCNTCRSIWTSNFSHVKWLTRLSNSQDNNHIVIFLSLLSKNLIFESFSAELSISVTLCERAQHGMQSVYQFGVLLKRTNFPSSFNLKGNELSYRYSCRSIIVCLLWNVSSPVERKDNIYVNRARKC